MGKLTTFNPELARERQRARVLREFGNALDALTPHSLNKLNYQQHHDRLRAAQQEDQKNWHRLTADPETLEITFNC